MIYTTEETRIHFLKEIDKYGDNYTMEATPKSLLDTFQEIDKQRQEALDRIVKKEEPTPSSSLPSQLASYVDETSILKRDSTGDIGRSYWRFYHNTVAGS